MRPFLLIFGDMTGIKAIIFFGIESFLADKFAVM